MVSYNGMGSAPGETRMLFAGCSAGGRGVLTNLDAVAHTLRKIAPSVRVQGFLDAAAWVDVEPVIPVRATSHHLPSICPPGVCFIAPPCFISRDTRGGACFPRA